MAPPTRTPPSKWIDEALRALAAGGPDAGRVEALARAPRRAKGGGEQPPCRLPALVARRVHLGRARGGAALPDRPGAVRRRPLECRRPWPAPSRRAAQAGLGATAGALEPRCARERRRTRSIRRRAPGAAMPAELT